MRLQATSIILQAALLGLGSSVSTTRLDTLIVMSLTKLYPQDALRLSYLTGKRPRITASSPGDSDLWSSSSRSFIAPRVQSPTKSKVRDVLPGIVITTKEQVAWPQKVPC